MSFPRYPRYKDTGIEWLGDVPEHWQILKGYLIGTLFGSEQVPEDSVSDEGELPFIKVGSLSLNSFAIESWDWFVNRAVAGQYKPRCGYIVFPKRGAAIFTNKVNIVECQSLIDPNLMGWEIGDNATPKFVAYILKMRKLDVLADVSTVPQINYKHIAPERFPVPPLAEQQRITAFLDRETAKIDGLVGEQRRLIELLKEKRQAVISRAVTKGLNPHAPMKPSGIEWLGDVPEHWQTTAVRHVVSEHKQGFYTKNEYSDDGTPLLRITDIRDDTSIDFSSCPKLIVLETERQQFGLSIGDFVFVRSGATIGKFGIVEAKTDAIFGSYTIRFRFRKSVIQQFLKWHFQSQAFLDGLFASLHGGAIVNVNAENIKDQVLAIPPRSEQTSIAEFLESVSVRLDGLVAEARRVIDLLQERRTALISAAVTGKIDVRGLAETEAA